MIKILEISFKNQSDLNFKNSFYKYNILFYLKNEKQIIKVRKINLIIHCDQNEEYFQIYGNEDKICDINVYTKENQVFFSDTKNSGHFILNQLKKWYLHNNWDTVLIDNIDQKINSDEFIIENIFFKKKIDKTKIELINEYKQDYIDFSIKFYKGKVLVEKISFYKSILNPLIMQYRFNNISFKDTELIFSDSTKQIFTIINLITFKCDTVFKEDFHSLEFLKKFEDSLNYKSSNLDLKNIFPEYIKGIGILSN